MDQRGVWQAVMLRRSSDKDLCPVKAMAEWYGRMGKRTCPAFQHENIFPLTQYQFWAVIHVVWRQAGLDVYGTHFSHIGVASTAANLGFSTPEVQCLGRWRFQAY